MILSYLLTFCRIVIGLAFAISFVAKARDVAQFAATIDRFDLLPPSWIRPVALLFLGGEAAVVVLIIAGGRLLFLAFGLATLLLFVFTLALLSALRRGIETSCNCFGASEKPLTYYDVGRNAGFIACSLLGWWLVPQVAGSPAAQNWLALAWQGVAAIGSGDGLVTLLTINALLTWLVLLPTAFFMLLLGKRFRQLDQGSPKEHILKEASSRRGQLAPPFEAQNIDGQTVTLDSFKGRDVAFLFLSPSCKPCVEKIPALNDYHRQGTANGMEMVMVNVDQ
ncbi:MAG: redoxin domain-containing protein, partial [Chloroflexota bacterium]